MEKCTLAIDVNNRIFLSGYQWEDGIGPKENRPVRPDLIYMHQIVHRMPL